MTRTSICRRIVPPVLYVGSLMALVPVVAADSTTGGAGKPMPNLSAGKAAYEQHCARCHGLTGKGDGRDAKRLYPRPRDLSSGIFKFRSTASGTSPTDDDLFKTLTQGLPGSGMPDWRHLDEAVRWQLVSYLKSLSTNFETNPPQPVAIGRDPGITHANLQHGKQAYEKLGCAACHGAAGRANGPSAAGLVDDWGRPIRPTDLRQGWNYRGGDDPQAIAVRVLTGISGAPMPSYAEAASTDEVWQLAYYVRSLQEEPRWAVIVHAAHLSALGDGPNPHERSAASLPESPTDARWKAVERVDVRLRNVVSPDGEMAAPQTVTAVSFQAVFNEQALSLRVSWHDPSDNRSSPADALALALRPPRLQGDVVTLQAWPLPDSPALDLCVWSANHQRNTTEGQAREAVTNRLEPLLEDPQQGVALSSQAVYEDGQWSVVLVRPLERKDLENAARFTPDRFLPIAFVVWDGGNPGQRAVSPWVDVVLRTPPTPPPESRRPPFLVWAMSGVVLAVGLVLALKKKR